MAARHFLARIANNDSAARIVRGGLIGPPSSTGSRRHIAITNYYDRAPMTTAAASSDPSVVFRRPVAQHRAEAGRSSFFSTATNAVRKPTSKDDDEGAKHQKKKKSPHSKLLRVCSERNSNSHFAAIEADMLRLNWKEAMDALVEDWAQKLGSPGGTGDNFVELERNVRRYVRRNLPDLMHYESNARCEWEENAELKTSIRLADHLGFHLFPYEDIIARIVNGAVSGRVILSSFQMKETGGDRDKMDAAILRERMMILKTGGTLLDAMMTSFESHVADDEDGGTTGCWTMHHAACSNCHRRVISGCFILNRRLRGEGGNEELMSKSSSGAADILEMKMRTTTSNLDIDPEHEMHSRVEKWIDFCDGRSSSSSSGGIREEDRPLLVGITESLSLSGDDELRMRATRLSQRLDEMFADKE